MDHYFRYEAIRRRLRVGPLSGYLDAFARSCPSTAMRSTRAATTAGGIPSESVDGPPEPASPRSQRPGPEALPRGSTTPGASAEHRPEGIGLVPGALATDGRRGANAAAPRRWRAGGPRGRFRAISPPKRAGRDDDRQLLGGRGTFLTTHFDKETADPQRLRPSDVIRFVHRIAQSKPSPSAKFTITGLRAFLHFLYVQGRTATDLTPSVPTVPHWKVTAIPRSLKEHEVESLLRSCDRTTGVGKRDYAVLCLLARLGLRAGESPP